MSANPPISLTADPVLCSSASSFVPAAPSALQCGRFEATPNSRWYCVETSPQCEISVLFQIDKLGFPRHFPREVTKRKPAKPVPLGKGLGVMMPNPPFVETIRPFFPGYLFVMFDANQDEWTAICRTVGVRRLLRSSFGRPLPVPTQAIEDLMAMGRPGDGVIDDKYKGPAMPAVAPGSRVRITSGPFVNRFAICEMATDQRIILLHDWLGGGKVEMDRADVEAV